MGGASAPFYMVNPNHNWRNDPGISSVVEYKKRFAFTPVKCSDGTRIWWEPYYEKFLTWSAGHGRVFNDDDEYGHRESVEYITEADYIIRKLSETL